MRRFRRFRQAAALLCVTSLCAVGPPALAQKPTRESRQRAVAARKLYEDGRAAYQLGELDKAIETWKEGYELKDDPIFLYNIAQAYRQKADFQKAIFFYRAYLREDPKARNRGEVDERIAELQRQLEQRENASEVLPLHPNEPAPVAPEPAPAPEPPAAAVAAPDEELVPRHPGRTLQIGGAVTAGVGVAAVAAGVVFLLRSSSIEHDLETAARSGKPWSADLVDREAQGRRSQTLGWVGMGAGAACVLTGATLYFLGARERRLAVSAAGAGVVVTFAY